MFASKARFGPVPLPLGFTGGCEGEQGEERFGDPAVEAAGGSGCRLGSLVVGEIPISDVLSG